jgi:hypothetical protein
MGRKEDDIFKKLKREKPLVKRGDIAPLSHRDFGKPRVAGQASRSPLRHTAAPRKELTVFGEEEAVRRPAAGKPAASPDAVRKPEARAKRPHREEAADSIQVELKRPVRGASPRRDELVLGAERAQQRVKPRPAAARTRTSPRELEKPLQKKRKASPRERAYEELKPVRQPVVLRSGRAAEADGRIAFRHELKYYINYRDYALLRGVLKALMPLDPHAGPNGDYHIRSLYFDDAYEMALVEKMAGYDVRNKYRIRIYDFSDEVIKFEKKMKRGQYIAKTSIRLSREECEALIAGDYDCLLSREEPLAREIYLLMKNNLLRPRVTVDYYREAYVSQFENVRVTFDKNVRASLMLTDLFDLKAPVASVLEPGTMVLEVKFNKYLPPFIQSALNNVNTAQRSAISKYVLCRKFD